MERRDPPSASRLQAIRDYISLDTTHPLSPVDAEAVADVLGALDAALACDHLWSYSPHGRFCARCFASPKE